MDLDDEIIGDSDEEEVLTADQVILRLNQAWQNEKVAPVLLESQTDIIDLVMETIRTLDDKIASVKKGDMKAAIYRLQVDRIRFVITDYLRTRLKKIELYVDHILEDERNRPEGEPPHLSADEFRFAKSYSESLHSYLSSSVLSRMPQNMQRLDVSAMAIRPDKNAYVFLKANSDVDAVQITEGMGENRETVTMEIRSGEQHIMPFSCIHNYIRSGSVCLI